VLNKRKYFQTLKLKETAKEKQQRENGYTNWNWNKHFNYC